ncbi:MAG: hypothetical protein IPL97_12965 [Niastella sp.]|nr:hypothetical protein [Niastella sp.]
MEERLYLLPVKPGNIGNLQATKEKFIIYAMVIPVLMKRLLPLNIMTWTKKGRKM